MLKEICWICKKSTSSQNIKTRDGTTMKLQRCSFCDFHFFSEDYSQLIVNDQFEKHRLEKANLEVPEIKKDFENGVKQSEGYVKDFFSKKDESKTILEIGCSWGYFLKVMAEKGVNVVGLEMNPIRANYVNEALGITCYHSIDILLKNNLSFDKIFLFYTLEYIQDPINYIKTLFTLLNKGGAIYIITPNHNDILKDAWALSGYLNFFYEKMSIAYYTPKSITNLMEQLNSSDISYTLQTRQGYSFFNHLKWCFLNKPSTTGIVGGDNFKEDIINKIQESSSSLKNNLIDFIEEFDTKYKTIIEKEDCGNQILLIIKKQAKEN